MGHLVFPGARAASIAPRTPGSVPGCASSSAAGRQRLHTTGHDHFLDAAADLGRRVGDGGQAARAMPVDRLPGTDTSPDAAAA
ncbi:hypothetical protein I552_2685 [Mycobacterium xenopi 3993]|nr:hypothetical protein I552_2685 [Mycobacterium xenopi 3993]